MFSDFQCQKNPSDENETFQGQLMTLKNWFQCAPWVEQTRLLQFLIKKIQGVESLKLLLLRFGPATRDTVHVMDYNSKLNIHERIPTKGNWATSLPEQFSLDFFDSLQEEELMEIIKRFVVICDENVAVDFQKMSVSQLRKRVQEELEKLVAQLKKECEEMKKTTIEVKRDDEEIHQEGYDSERSSGVKKSKNTSKNTEKKLRKNSPTKKGKPESKEKGQNERNSTPKKSQRIKDLNNDETILRKTYKIPREPEMATDWMMSLPLSANTLIMSSVVTDKKDEKSICKVNEYWKHIASFTENERDTRKEINLAIKSLQAQK